jgi:hypothetical protein
MKPMESVEGIDRQIDYWVGVLREADDDEAEIAASALIQLAADRALAIARLERRLVAVSAECDQWWESMTAAKESFRHSREQWGHARVRVLEVESEVSSARSKNRSKKISGGPTSQNQEVDGRPAPQV